MSDRSCMVHPIDLEDAADPAHLVLQIKFVVKIFPVLVIMLCENL